MLKLHWIHEQSCNVSVNGKFIANFNYDDHGSTMYDIVNAMSSLAAAGGLTVMVTQSNMEDW